MNKTRALSHKTGIEEVYTTLRLYSNPRRARQLQQEETVCLLQLRLACYHYGRCRSCTVANVKEDVIPSGGAIELDFEWDTVGLGGSIQKPILLSFRGDESSTPWTQELLIAGDVLPDFEYSPFLVTFEAGEDATRTIQFSPIGDPDFRIRGAYCVHRAFDVAVDETRRSVTVSFDSDRWREFSRNVNVVVQTNCKTSSVGIPIRVESRKMQPILNVDLSQ